MVQTFKHQSEYKVIGSRPVRHDGFDKVTGRAIYGGDIKLPGLIWGALTRSPHAHAKIKSIDTRAAEKIEGVLAIITSKDMPETEDKLVDLGEGDENPRWTSNKLMAQQKVLYKGHPVAAVAAVNRYIAEHAATKIKVEYEVLEAHNDVDSALRQIEKNNPEDRAHHFFKNNCAGVEYVIIDANNRFIFIIDNNFIDKIYNNFHFIDTHSSCC